MAKLNLNPLLRSLQGRIGDLVFVHEGDSIYVRHAAEKRPLFRSPAQVAHTSRFVVASRWARTLLVNPAMRKLYQHACHDHLTPHNIAVRDYMHAPVVDAIDLESYTGNPDDIIRILASDDFKIVHMAVQILTVDRQIVEEGEAEWNAAAACWVYVTRTQVRPETTVLIEAAAMDLPGNRGTAKAYFYVSPVPADSPLTINNPPTSINH
jgi:hypothetical protein